MKKRDFSILKEVISPDNVEVMSELIALQETKYLIAFIGAPMIAIRNDLYKDLYRKHEAAYQISSSYDLVQECALFLCEHFGKKLSDVHHFDKKGKKITIQMQAIRRLFPNHHTHELRYTFITRVKESGVNQELVMLWDGHEFDKKVKTSKVDRGYTNYSLEYQLREVEKITYEL